MSSKTIAYQNREENNYPEGVIICLSFNLKRKIMECFAGVAQLVEHHLAKVDVEGSNPFARSKFFKPLKRAL
jgi:hypothetical protein